MEFCTVKILPLHDILLTLVMKMIIAKFKRIRGGRFLFTWTSLSLFCFFGTNLIAAILAEQESGERSLS